MNIKEVKLLESLSDKLLEKLEDYQVKLHLPDGSKGIAVLDPIDKRVIGSHYSLSHYCVSLFIQSYLRKSSKLLKEANESLQYLLYTWDVFSHQADYHNDFNNFAIALLIALNREKMKGIISKSVEKTLEEKLLNSLDSNHMTVNWLAMRYFNNLMRYNLNNDSHFILKANNLLSSIRSAMNQDGLFDDLLPKGKSANPQYHTATLAVLVLIKQLKISLLKDDSFDKSLHWLLTEVDPEGDFNYFGRGTNQLFGWGPFIFVLGSFLPLTADQFSKSMNYLSVRLPLTLSNDNILLNEFSGNQRIWWWDYHHVSVYLAHSLMWLSLVQLFIDQGFKTFNTSYNNSRYSIDLDITKNDTFFAAVFKGRKHYLAESGPILCNLWIQKYGSVFKGPFGPFLDAFGHNYSVPRNIIANHFGILREKKTIGNGLKIFPVFPEKLSLVIKGNKLIIKYSWKKRINNTRLYFNIPILSKSIPDNFICERKIMKILAENQILSVRKVGSFLGPYGDTKLFISEAINSLINLEVHVNAYPIL